MKFLLDLSPGAAFWTAYFVTGRDIYSATLVLIISLFAVVAYYLLRHGQLHKVHMAAAVSAAVLGGITLYVHDPRFIESKPTVIYALFALVLLASHFVGDKVLLQRLPQHVIVLPDAVWRRVNLAWVGYFAWCAVLNFYLARHVDVTTWVNFKAFGFSAMMFVFLLAHVPFLARYLPQEQQQ